MRTTIDKVQPASRLLVIDAGNSNITFGVCNGKTIEHQWRIQSRSEKSSDEYGIQLEQILLHFGYQSGTIKDVIIGSVVPSLNHAFVSLCNRYLSLDPYIVGEGTKTGMPIRLENPRDVGADRIIDAVAGYEKYGGPLVIVDIGTAITHEAISSKGEYLGGSIAPGVNIGLEGLTTKTAKLPKVELTHLNHSIGKNTIEAMQIGIVQGYLGLVDHLTENMIHELEKTEKEKIKVVATGGFSGLLTQRSRFINIIDRDLCLDGLRIIYERTIKAKTYEK